MRVFQNKILHDTWRLRYCYRVITWKCFREKYFMTLEGHRINKAGKHKMTHVRPYSPAVRLMRRTSNRLSDKVPERRSGHLPAGSGALNTTWIIVKSVFINFGTIFYMTIVLLQSFAWDCFEAKYYMSLQDHRTIIEFMHESISNKIFHDRRTATEFIHESVLEQNNSWHLKTTVLTKLAK